VPSTIGKGIGLTCPTEAVLTPLKPQVVSLESHSGLKWCNYRPLVPPWEQHEKGRRESGLALMDVSSISISRSPDRPSDSSSGRGPCRIPANPVAAECRPLGRCEADRAVAEEDVAAKSVLRNATRTGGRASPSNLLYVKFFPSFSRAYKGSSRCAHSRTTLAHRRHTSMRSFRQEQIWNEREVDAICGDNRRGDGLIVVRKRSASV
jgi:hypothetical protein